MTSPKLRASAIAVGVIANMGGGMLAALVYGIGYTVFLAFTGVPMDQLEARLNADTGAQVIQLIMGLTFAGVGGYVAGAMAGMRELGHAARVGAISVVLGLALWVPLELGSAPLWQTIPAFVLEIPAAVSGGYLAARRNARRPAARPPVSL